MSCVVSGCGSLEPLSVTSSIGLCDLTPSSCILVCAGVSMPAAKVMPLFGMAAGTLHSQCLAPQGQWHHEANPTLLELPLGGSQAVDRDSKHLCTNCFGRELKDQELSGTCARHLRKTKDTL